MSLTCIVQITDLYCMDYHVTDLYCVEYHGTDLHCSDYHITDLYWTDILALCEGQESLQVIITIYFSMI